MSDDVYELRADLDAALARARELEDYKRFHDGHIEGLRARVKELESERDANANAYFARLAHIEAANADRARLRSALEQVRSAMEASDQGPDGDNDPRRPLASAVWAAIATTDASRWLAERERRVAERVREACVRASDRWFASRPPPNSSPTEVLCALDLDAFLKEET